MKLDMQRILNYEVPTPDLISKISKTLSDLPGWIKFSLAVWYTSVVALGTLNAHTRTENMQLSQELAIITEKLQPQPPGPVIEYSGTIVGVARQDVQYAGRSYGGPLFRIYLDGQSTEEACYVVDPDRTLSVDELTKDAHQAMMSSQKVHFMASEVDPNILNLESSIKNMELPVQIKELELY